MSISRVFAKYGCLIDINCSVVKTLVNKFPEVAALGKNANDGQVKLLELGALLKPYLFGKKEYPN